jgi:hypothetical protein
MPYIFSTTKRKTLTIFDKCLSWFLLVFITFSLVFLGFSSYENAGLPVLLVYSLDFF